jgi:alpha-L-rhamnosidase
MTNILWTIRGNLHSVFTDAPQRAEREGYMGSEMLVSQTACFDVDMSAFYTKWIRDIRTAQAERSDGSYAMYAPYNATGWGATTDVGWQVGGIIFPWQLYLNYGDIRMLAEHYGSATNWNKYLAGRCFRNGNWTYWSGSGITYFDWLSGDAFSSHPADWNGSYGSAGMNSTGYGTAWCAASADVLAGMSRALYDQAVFQGNIPSAGFFSSNYACFTNMAVAVRTAYTNVASGIVQYSGGVISGIGGNRQADFVSALHYDMVPESQRASVANKLVANTYGITNYNKYCSGASLCYNHISPGNQFAAREMLVLTRNGYTPKAYQILTNAEFPGWLYWVTNGATTCWERWNSYLSGPRSVTPPANDRGYLQADGSDFKSFNSFNSLPFAAVGEWVWNVIAGVNVDETNPGFKNVLINPQPGGGITWSSNCFNCIRGPIITAWTINTGAGTYYLNVALPANATASIYLPSGNLGNITESGCSPASAPGVQYYYATNLPYWTNSGTVVQVGSGTYSFAVTNAAFY